MKTSEMWIALGGVFAAGFVCAVSVISPTAMRAAPASAVVIGFLLLVVLGLALAASGGVAAWQWHERRARQERWERTAQLYSSGQRGERRSTARRADATQPGTVLTLPVRLASPIVADDEDDPMGLSFGKWGPQ